MTALTPLLAGNYQIAYEHLSSALKAEFERLCGNRGAHAAVSLKKTLIEPLRLGRTDCDPPDQLAIAGVFCPSWTLSVNGVLEFSTYRKEILNVEKEVFIA
jgi:hypothetical protein